MWPAPSLAFTVRRQGVWERSAPPDREEGDVRDDEEPPPPAEDDENVEPTVVRRRPNKLRDAALRRAAAATNTSLFVAKAQQRAAQRAARRRVQAASSEAVNKARRPESPPLSRPRKTWDASPLSKLCDRDAQRAANIERRIRGLQVRANTLFVHRDDAPNLEAARSEIRRRRRRETRVDVPSPRTPDDLSSTSTPRDRHLPVSPAAPEEVFPDVHPECVGSPREKRKMTPPRRARSTVTRPTSPFDDRILRRALDAPALAWNEEVRDPPRAAPPQPQQERWDIPQQNDAVERRASLSAIADVGVMARAVAGLVGSASRTMELHEDRQRRDASQYHQLAAFQTWQSRAQQQLDASLRLQQQQLAATLADWRAAVLSHPHYAPPSHQEEPVQAPLSQKQQSEEPAHPNVRRHAPAAPNNDVPFAGAVPRVPRSDVDLVERLWEKISEIEDDERAVARRLGEAPRPQNPLATVPGPAPPVEGAATAVYIPPDGSSVSLPLGVVASLVDYADEEPRERPPQIERPTPREERRDDDLDDDAWRRVLDTAKRKTSLQDDDHLLLDASVPPDIARRVLDHVDALKTHRRVAEADLLGSGLTQTQIVDVLADEFLDILLSETTAEVDSILADCSESILDNA